MFQGEGINESLTTPLGKVTSTRALVGGLKSAWLFTPKQHNIRRNWQRILEAVKTQYGSSNTVTQQEEALCHIDPLVTRARGAPGLSWSNTASTLLARQVASAGAVSSLLVVTDERSFRSAVYKCIDGLRTKPQLELFRAELQWQLEPQHTSTYAWFLTGGAHCLPSTPHVPSQYDLALGGALDPEAPTHGSDTTDDLAASELGPKLRRHPLPHDTVPLRARAA